jgi:hypothetical protein
VAAVVPAEVIGRRVGTIAQVVIGIEFLVAVAIILYAGLREYRNVFEGAPQAVPVRVEASCSGAGTSTGCHAVAQEFTPGRHRIATDAAGVLTVTVSTDDPARARNLLVRVGTPAALTLAVTASSPDGATEVTNAGRVVVALPQTPSTTLTFRVDEKTAAGPIVLEELGVFEGREGLLNDTRRFFPAIPPARYTALAQRAVVALSMFTVLAAIFLPARSLKRYAPPVLAIVCVSLCLLDLTVLFSPFGGHDLRSFYANGPLLEPPGANLNGALHQSMRLLEGRGLTTTDGVVPWERMPGYALFCATAGLLFGHHSLVDLALSTVLLQTVFYAAALGIFAAAAMPLFTPAGVWAVGMLIAWLPKQLGFTQVDAIIAPAALLILAALAIRIDCVRRSRPVPVGVDILIHASFALWFVLRPDVLPGWAVIAIVLHAKQWRRLLIPAAFFLVVGATWGVYKARYTGEFALTTTSAGASLFCGLFEVPSRFRFAQACTDDTYFEWIRRLTPMHPQSAAANSVATRAVLRFWATYPGHVIVMVYDKMMQLLNGDLWPGYVTQLQLAVFGVVPRYVLVITLLTAVAVCLAIGYERARTLLFAWPLLLNAPLFFVMFASFGRFYSAVGVALLAASVPQLFEPDFYAAVLARKRQAGLAVACMVVFAVTAWPIRTWLLANDALHYWTPVLSPSNPVMATFK